MACGDARSDQLSAEERWLAGALRAAAASGAAGKALRALQWQEFEVSRACAGRPAAGREGGRAWEQPAEEIEALEVVFMRIQRAMGEPRPVNVGQAKRWLRDCADPRGGAVASMLGNLSKARNVRAHALSARLLAGIDELVMEKGPTVAESGSVEVFDISTDFGDDFSGVERVDASTQTGLSLPASLAVAVVYQPCVARAGAAAPPGGLCGSAHKVCEHASDPDSGQQFEKYGVYFNDGVLEPTIHVKGFHERTEARQQLEEYGDNFSDGMIEPTDTGLHEPTVDQPASGQQLENYGDNFNDGALDPTIHEDGVHEPMVDRRASSQQLEEYGDNFNGELEPTIHEEGLREPMGDQLDSSQQLEKYGDSLSGVLEPTIHEKGLHDPSVVGQLDPSQQLGVMSDDSDTTVKTLHRADVCDHLLDEGRDATVKACGPKHAYVCGSKQGDNEKKNKKKKKKKKKKRKLQQQQLQQQQVCVQTFGGWYERAADSHYT